MPSPTSADTRPLDLEAARHTANVWARGYDESLVAEKNLALAYLALVQEVERLRERAKSFADRLVQAEVQLEAARKYQSDLLHQAREDYRTLNKQKAELEAAREVIEAAREISRIEATGVLPDFQPLADALAKLDAGEEE